MGMARRELRTSTGRTNRSLSAMSLHDDAPGPSSPAPQRSEEAVNTRAERLVVGTGADGERQWRSRTSLGLQAADTRLSISAGKSGNTGPGVEQAAGDALDQLLSSAEEKTGRNASIRSPLARRDTALSEQQSTPPRAQSEIRAAFLALPMTPNEANRARLAKIRGNYSQELKALQSTLLSNEGRPLSALQKALVFDKQNDASRATVDEELKRAVAVATDNKVVPSDALVAELRQLSRARPGKQVDYKELLQVVWDERLMEISKRDVKPGRGEYLKYLFLVGNSAGCYNDNIEPKPSLFGVKKGSSSVRYSLFTNNDVDMSTTFKLVPEQMMKAVDDNMKVSVSYHPTTGRPLDPWLSYLAVSQGKKCDQRPTDQVCPANHSHTIGIAIPCIPNSCLHAIIEKQEQKRTRSAVRSIPLCVSSVYFYGTVAKPLTGPLVSRVLTEFSLIQPCDIINKFQRQGISREWDSLPNLSFGFTKMHKALWRNAERRNLIL